MSIYSFLTGVAYVVLVTGFLVTYFFPTLVSRYRGHRKGTPILVVNLLTGWTLIGWVAALVWSLTDVGEPRLSRPGHSTA